MLQNLPRTCILQVEGQGFVLFGFFRHRQLHGSLSPELRSLDPGLGTSSISILSHPILPFVLSCKHARDVLRHRLMRPHPTPDTHAHYDTPVLGIMVPRDCLNRKLKNHRTVPLRARQEAVSGRGYLWGTVEHSWLFGVLEREGECWKRPAGSRTVTSP